MRPPFWRSEEGAYLAGVLLLVALVIIVGSAVLAHG